MIPNQWGKKKGPTSSGHMSLKGPFTRKALLAWEIEIMHIGSVQRIHNWADSKE